MYVFPNVAGFVAGRPVQLVVQVGNPLIPLSSNIVAAFIQDDWRPTSTLTLNLGVRYDYTDSTIPEISSGEILDFGGDFLPLQGREDPAISLDAQSLELATHRFRCPSSRSRRRRRSAASASSIPIS